MISPIEMAKRHLNGATHRLFTMPILVLSPHSRCNCRCVMCDIWKANQNRQELTVNDLSPHVADLRRLGVQWVTFSGGEALMHSNLWALMELLKVDGITLTLLSTGLLLKHHAESILRWCDEVIVSLDGSQAVHDAIRNLPEAYERLTDGVQALHARVPQFPVGARCVLQRANFRDLPNIVRAARSIGIDRISFLAADLSTEAFNRPTGWGRERVSEVALSRDEVAEFNQIIERMIVDCAEEFSRGFIEESPAKLRRIGQYYAAIHGLVPFPDTICNAPWVSAVIEPNGDVRPCFFHPPKGNIRRNSLLEIVNGPENVRFRQQLEVKTDPICRKCVCTLSVGRGRNLRR